MIKMNINRMIADRLPEKIVYYVGIRIWAHATTNMWADKVASEVTMDEGINRWLEAKIHKITISD